MTEEDKTEANLREHGVVFAQLLQSVRFKQLLNIYFTIQQTVDEEKKEINLQVIENPPEVIAVRMKQQADEDAKSLPNIEVVSGALAEQVLRAPQKARLKKKR